MKRDVATMNAIPWRSVELTLSSQRPHENPYAELEVTAQFTGPDGAVIARPAFWDGGDNWKVRFAPPAPGLWAWRTACSDTADDGLHDRRGAVTCLAGAGETAVQRHGFLRVSANCRHFVHADGTPFFWLGDTHWQMPDTERLDACNHPEHGGGACPFGGQFQHLAADRKARGFTVYQTYPSATDAHWWTIPYACVNPERFRAVFDPQMDHLAAQGFVIALGCGHFNNSTRIPVADLCRWARYLVARYGAHPVVWITCQEMNAPAELGGKEANRLDVWRAVAAEIARVDGYGHPHSAHQWVLNVDERSLALEPWHDWFALQGGHRGSGLTPQARYAGYYAFQSPRPMLETEAMYEQIDCGGVADADDARISAWRAMLCGCAGYTYGAGGVWALKWDPADPRWITYNYPVAAWYAGMALPGTAQMTVLKDLLLGLPWTELVPRFQDPEWSTWVDAERSVLATVGNRLYVAYCHGDTSAGTLRQLDCAAAYSARWFNPRNGQFADSATVVRAPAGEWRVPEKPAGDWVLVLRQLDRTV